MSVALDWLDSKYQIGKKLNALCDQGLAKLNAVALALEKRGVATYHRFEHSQVVRDLSRETHELIDWAGRHMPRLQWHPLLP